MTPGLVPTCAGSGIVSDTLGSANNSSRSIGFSCSASSGFDLAENISTIAGRHEAKGCIIVNNNYCTPTNGIVTMNFSTDYIYDGAVPAPASVSGNIITWNFSGLTVGALPQLISYSLKVPGAWLLPGDTVQSGYMINPFIGDLDTSNNNCTKNDTVKTSFDPNEMSVTPSGYILPETVLEYAINFENTGNDTAFNIAVMDTLPANVDTKSLQIIASSAKMNTLVYSDGGYNIVKFDFPGINLLDSSHHNQCDGMIMFHVKTSSGLTDGATVFNHAGIFFDDNPVVMTDTVENIVSFIHGPTTVCPGSQIILSDLATGGVWSITNASATISGDTVTGVNAGLDTFTYTIHSKYGNTFTTKTVTVSAAPAVITGTPFACPGSSTSLSDASGGGNWSSSAPGTAEVGSISGIVTGVSTGTVIITYSAGFGCVRSVVVTVNPLPSAISGTPLPCIGTTVSLSDATPGGSWSSGDAGIATVSGTGIVFGVSAGTVLVTYTSLQGCVASLTATVVPSPAIITGASSLCPVSSITLSDSTLGGVWNSSNPAVLTVMSTTGVVSGVSAGTAEVTYSLSPGCQISRTVTVNALPSAISGPAFACASGTITLSDILTGGTWSSSSPAIASVNSSGVVSAVSTGTTIITYASAYGCKITNVITVNPATTPIEGATSICAGVGTPLSNAASGGSWSSATPGIASVDVSTGIVTGLSAGTAIISYALSPGCISATAITIKPTPVAIAGSAMECVGSSSAPLADAVPGGTWSASSGAAATVNPAGVVIGVSAGTAIISYMLSSGCYATIINTVNPLPSPITGSDGVCVGSATPLTATPVGGNWMSSDPLIATTDISGLVSGASAGTTDITYTITGGCYTTFTVTVSNSPGPIAGTFSLCAGSTTNLYNPTPGGTWSSSMPGVASVATIGATTGVVIGMTAGVDIISYVVTAGCSTTALVTVYAIPALSVTATQAGCGGSYDLVSAGALSYNWAPAGGVVCSTCSANTVYPRVTTTYTVTGTGLMGCTAKDTVTVDANRGSSSRRHESLAHPV